MKKARRELETAASQGRLSRKRFSPARKIVATDITRWDGTSLPASRGRVNWITGEIFDPSHLCWMTADDP